MALAFTTCALSFMGTGFLILQLGLPDFHCGRAMSWMHRSTAISLSDEMTIDCGGSYLCLCSTLGANVVSFGKYSKFSNLYTHRKEMRTQIFCSLEICKFCFHMMTFGVMGCWVIKQKLKSSPCCDDQEFALALFSRASQGTRLLSLLHKHGPPLSSPSIQGCSKHRYPQWLHRCYGDFFLPKKVGIFNLFI